MVYTGVFSLHCPPTHWLTINDISEERWIIDVITEETYMGEVELGGIKQAEDWQG